MYSASTQDGDTNAVMAPKDADGRSVPLDTKVVYDDKGIGYAVFGLVFRSMPEICEACWTVECITAENEVSQVSLDYMHLTPPDSWEKLEGDLDRAAGKMYCGTCAYFGKNPPDCDTCHIGDTSPCDSAAMRDIADRIRKLRGED